MSEIQGEDLNKYKPYENSGIIEGDIIVSINETEINSTDELIECVNKSNGKEVSIKYLRNETVYTTNIIPTKSATKEYKLGLWVRDTAAGVGTCTFYEPSTNMFGALGHGIIDIDTEQLISIAKGDIVTTSIVGISKGTKGNPGELKGTIENQENIGQISKNTSFGIFGTLTKFNLLNINRKNEYEVALREEIKTGSAKIICTVENERKEYDIEIIKTYLNNNRDNKSMLIEITDEQLLKKTGGIIQGMSGSPIIQNGKFIGAVTHVLVSDPTKGYGVFGDLMIKQLKQVE